MILVAAFIAFLFELLAGDLRHWRQGHWFARWSVWLEQRLDGARLWNATPGVLLTVGLPLALVVLVQGALEDVWFGVLSLVFAVAVLLYSLRYQELDDHVDAYLDACEAGEMDRAREQVELMRGAPLNAEDCAANTVAGAVTEQANERLFAVLFWFVVLGAGGAALYRLAWWAAAQPTPPARDPVERMGYQRAALRLLAILDWIPARLAVFTYALAGSFDDAVHQGRQQADEAADMGARNHAWLRGAGLGALNLTRYQVSLTLEADSDAVVEFRPELVRAARSLVLRSLMIWAVVVALLSLTLWD